MGTGRTTEICAVKISSTRKEIRVFSLILSALLDENGELEEILSVARDITEASTREELLGLAKTVIDNSPAIIFKWKATRGWPVEYVSENISLLGYSPQEVTRPGWLYTSIMHPDDIEMVERETEKYLSECKDSHVHEYRVIRKDGAIIWVREENRPEYNENNELVRLVGVITDDTERIKARMELEESNFRLQKTFEQSIEILARTVGRRDPYTAHHQKRVAKLARAIAEKLGLDDHSIKGLYLAAVVHDVGKISVPAEILSKPTTLSSFEMEIIKVHPQSSYEILKDLDTPWPLAEIAGQHHERMDGSGYPDGLTDREILKEAKILAVADVVEASSSHRPYRAGLGIGKALEIIREERGIKLDKEAVDACLELFEEGFSLDLDGDQIKD